MNGSSTIMEVANLLVKALQGNEVAEANQKLNELSKSTPEYPLLLMEVIDTPHVDFGARMMAAILVKKYIVDFWPQFTETTGELFIPPKTRKMIMERIFGNLGKYDQAYETQICAAFCEIVKYDFPEKWPTMVEEMTPWISVENLKKTYSILVVLHSVFDRYRHERKGKELYQEIRSVIDNFTPKYIEFIKELDNKISATSDNSEFETCIECMILVVNILQDLNSQDIADFFQDNMNFFLDFFNKYLTLKNENNIDFKGISLCRKLKSKIIKCLEYFIRVYSEDLPDLFYLFEPVCSLLLTPNNESHAADIIHNATEFLKSMMQVGTYKDKFKNIDVMKRVCESAVIQNMSLQESDIDQFVDDPELYIDCVFSGRYTNDRRTDIVNFVSFLTSEYPIESTKILSSYLYKYLEEYPKYSYEDSNIILNNAIFLFTTLAVKSRTTVTGAMTLNPEIPTPDILVKYILPILRSTLLTQDIVKVEVMACLYLFVNQFSKEQLKNIITILVPISISENVAACRGALLCLERILSRNNQAQIELYEEGGLNEPLKLVVQHCFARINKDSSNPGAFCVTDFYMRAILKILVFSKDTLSMADMILENLIKYLELLVTIPHHEKLTYYIFETLGFTLKSIAASNLNAFSVYESILFTVFNNVITKNLLELMPYTILMLGLLISLNAGQKIPEKYHPLIKRGLLLDLWSSKANIPSLTIFFGRVLYKDPLYLVESGNLPTLLGIIQKLLEAKIFDHNAFELLDAVFLNVETQYLAEYIKPLFIILLRRLMDSKGDVYQRFFVIFICSLILMNKKDFNVDEILRVFSEIQNENLFCDIMQGRILPDLNRVITPMIRLLSVQALLKLITESQAMLREPYVRQWSSVIKTINKICNVSSADLGECAFEKTGNTINNDRLDLPMEYESEYFPIETASLPKKTYGLKLKLSDLKNFASNCLTDFDRKFDHVVQRYAMNEYMNLVGKQ